MDGKSSRYTKGAGTFHRAAFTSKPMRHLLAIIALGAINTPAITKNGIKNDVNDTNYAIRVEGVGADSIQGDIRFIEAAQAMGAVVNSGPNHLAISR